MSQIDILSVGDTVIDAFIKLLDDKAVSFENDNGRWLAMPFGAKLPFAKAEVVEGVGNAANAAVSFAKLGLNSGLVANVGNDKYGRSIIEALNKQGVDTRFVLANPGKKTNYHYVLWYKEERTILINHEEYDYEWPRFRGKDIPKWIYFSSISENALEYHDDLAQWLNENPEVKLAFQPGTFQIAAGAERLAAIYQRTEVLLLNREEAADVSGGALNDLGDLFGRLHNLGPRIVVITDGPSGAFASDGQTVYSMPPYPDPAPPYERTGAGDAFSSAFVASLVKGNTIEGALQWAPINSMNVVQHVGAQEGLLTEQQIEEYLKKAPSEYQATPL